MVVPVVLRTVSQLVIRIYYDKEYTEDYLDNDVLQDSSLAPVGEEFGLPPIGNLVRFLEIVAGTVMGHLVVGFIHLDIEGLLV